MKLAMIAAVAENNAIGINNKMPWHIPGELAYFKSITMGKPIIMGRNTFDSLGKPLPGRTNIVVTRDKSWHFEGVKVAHTLNNALTLAEEFAQIGDSEEIMVIGGETIYRQVIDQADRLYLTRIYHSFDADAFFPEVDLHKWHEVQRKDMLFTENQEIKYSYLVFEKTISSS